MSEDHHGAPQQGGRRSRTGRLLVLLAALALLSLISALAANAAAGSAEVVLSRAGALARHGAPVVALLADAAGAIVLGGAVLAGWSLEGRQLRRALGVIAIAAGAWTVLKLLGLLTSYAVATGQGLLTPGFGSDLGIYLTTDLGAWLLTSVILSAATTTVAAGASTVAGARAVALCAGAAVLASAMTGHASGTAGHETATSTMLVHLLAAGIWVGGLAVLLVLEPGGPDDPRVIRAFSRLALVCWIALAASGIWALGVRMNGWGDLLTSAYVQIALAKAGLLLILGALGAIQRSILARRGPFDAGLFRRVALAELALMGLALALAAAMSSSPPPADRAVPSTEPAYVLTGYPLPPAPTPLAVLTAVRPDVFALALAAVLALIWWWPTAPARSRRGTGLLLGGIGAWLAATCWAPAVSAKVLVSAFVIEHLLLLLVAGPLLALALVPPKRERAARSPRSWVPAVLSAAAVALPVAVIASPWLSAILASHVGHLSLLVGTTALGGVIAVAARRHRLALPAAGAVLAGAGAWMLRSPGLIAASWFGATGRTYAADAMADQRTGAVIVIAAGAAVLLAGAVQARGSVGSKISRTATRRDERSSRSTNGS